MNINVRYETVYEMLELCKQLKEDRLDLKRLEKLLEHEDYQVEFARYKGRVSKEEFIDFFSNFFKLNYDEITNDDFKAHYQNYTYLFENLELYEKECEKLKDYTEEMFIEQTKKALLGLPKGFEYGDLNFIFTISIGMSFGWVHENNSHFDVIQLIKMNTLEGFKSSLAHEIHHIAMNRIFDDVLDFEKISPEELFYVYFSGEGLAVKYCNNAEGNLSKSIYDEQKNIGLDEYTWEYLNNDFEDTFNTFKNQVNMIRSREIKDTGGVQNLIGQYWMNFHTPEQDKNEPPKLMQCRLYSFGNELWGVIHDAFGKEKVFETIRNLKEFPKVYNDSVKKIGKEAYMI